MKISHCLTESDLSLSCVLQPQSTSLFLASMQQQFYVSSEICQGYGLAASTNRRSMLLLAVWRQKIVPLDRDISILSSLSVLILWTLKPPHSHTYVQIPPPSAVHVLAIMNCAC